MRTTTLHLESAKRRYLKATFLILITICIVGVGLFVVSQPKSRAANLQNFRPGNIMSDAVMSDKNSMSVQDIQAFLVSKNPCNNTNIQLAKRYPNLKYHIKDGKFVCMAHEDFNGESAAQIIWRAAQDYNINPRVIIVLLEKEQGLITDTWPNHIQYRSATGFGCPDTAACDAQYYGLKNQVRHAAKLFRSVLDGGWSNYPVGQNYIRYNPKSWCGGSVVNIENRATSALYRYTPYQPNQSSLNAGYGTGDACGAYGNRNFWLFFSDWFGSPVDIHWQPMTSARWMRLKSSVKKIDVNSQNEVDELLASKRQLRFVDKVEANGNVYLRTEWDARHGYSKGIPIKHLEEIPFENITNPRFMVVTCDVKKIYPNTGVVFGQTFPRGLVAKFTTKTLVNGVWYLRTETDTRIGNNLGFPIDCVNTALTTQTLAFDTPRSLYIPTGVNLSNIAQPSQTVATKKNMTVFFSRKFYFNGEWYFQSEDDFKHNRLIGVARPLVTEAVNFIPMDTPRQLTLISDTYKTDLLTGKVVGHLISKGISRKFAQKFLYNGEWYLRTEYDTQTNLQYGIPLRLLK